MKISILSHNLSSNCLGRSYVLAQLLEQNHEVEIIGPKLGSGIWEPVRDEYNYKSVDTGDRIYTFATDVPALLEKTSGDVIYAVKPRLGSFGIGLLRSLSSSRPLVLDIDDWESGFKYAGRSTLQAYLREFPLLINTSSLYYRRALELLSSYADAKTVSNRFLRDKFGGTIVPHVRDTNQFDPASYNKDQIRSKLGLPENKFIIIFSGTPRPHKGVSDLAKAVASIDRDDIMAVIVGASESSYVNHVEALGNGSLRIEGMKPFSEIPKWIAAADAIAIPQRDTPATAGQLPAKVFDAMAMAKPVIATDVGDLPHVIQKAGVIVPPNDPESLRGAILKLASNRPLCDELGARARKRCVERYSYDALTPTIDEIVRSANR